MALLVLWISEESLQTQCPSTSLQRVCQCYSKNAHQDHNIFSYWKEINGCFYTQLIFFHHPVKCEQIHSWGWMDQKKPHGQREWELCDLRPNWQLYHRLPVGQQSMTVLVIHTHIHIRVRPSILCQFLFRDTAEMCTYQCNYDPLRPAAGTRQQACRL